MSLSLIIWNVLRCVWNLLNPGLRLLREKTAHTHWGDLGAWL